jgi:hypothetical protein
MRAWMALFFLSGCVHSLGEPKLVESTAEPRGGVIEYRRARTPEEKKNFKDAATEIMKSECPGPFKSTETESENPPKVRVTFKCLPPPVAK